MFDRMLAHIVPGHVLRAASLGLLASVVLVGPVLAAHEPPRLGLTPTGEIGQFFALSMEPGASRQLTVELGNFGHDSLLARTYAADAYTIINGGFAAELFGEAPSGTTQWLDYPDREVTLGPGEALVIDFTVSVPAATVPGEYIAALVAENAEPYRDAGAGGVSMDQVNRTVVAVAVEVPGPKRPALEIGSVGYKAAAGTSFVTFEVRNPGNVHIKPAGSFTLRDAAGVAIASSEPVMDSVYAGTDTLMEAALSGELAPGNYCAELALQDEETGVGDATTCLPFTAAAPPANDAVGPGSQTIPVAQPALGAVGVDSLLAGLALVAVLAALMILVVWIRRRRRASDSPEIEEQPPNSGAGPGEKVS